MKKFKLIIINIIVCLFIFILLEIGCILNALKNDFIFSGHTAGNKLELINGLIERNIVNYFSKFNLIYFSPPPYGFREPAIYKSSVDSKNKHKKRDIIIAGCSFTYGVGLKNEEAFHSVLSNYTKRSVYNWGLPGGSPREILYILRNTDVLYTLIPKDSKPEYFIYTNMSEHYKRLYSNYRNRVPVFIAKNNYTELQYYNQPAWLNKLYIIRQITYTLYDWGIFKNDKKLFKLYMDEIYKELKNRFGDIKFVIFLYQNDNNEIFKELEKEGIIVIKAKDILNVDLNELEYLISNRDTHPNAKAWQDIVPALAKELNL